MPDTAVPLRVIVADDDPVARRLVKALLQRAGLVVIAEALTGREAVDLSLHYRPDCVVMDRGLPEADGIAATAKIIAAAPETRVLLLTADDDEENAMRALRAGACGYLHKGIDLSSLPRIVRSACEGEAVISRRLTMRLIERYRGTREDGLGLRPVRSPLTSREWEVLDLLCAGASTEAIAEELVLSSETVRSHVKNLLRKLGVRSRAEAVAEAARLREQAAQVPALPDGRPEKNGWAPFGDRPRNRALLADRVR